MKQLITLLCLLGLSMTVGTDNPANNVPEGVNGIDTPYILKSARLKRQLINERQDFIDGIRNSTSLRLSMMEVIASLITSTDTVEMEGHYTWQPDTHDLRTIAGRAAWFIEGVSDLQLPAITADTSNQGRQNVFAQVRAHLLAFRQGVVSVSQDQRSLFSSVKANFPDGVSTAAQMAEFQRAWCPIGKRWDEVRAVIGDRATVPDATGVAMVSFGGRLGGPTYYFIVTDRIIEEVYMAYGE